MGKREKKKPAAPADKGAARAGGAKPRVWDRSDTRNALAVFGAALFLRLVFFFLNRPNNPLFEYPIMDSTYHL